MIVPLEYQPPPIGLLPKLGRPQFAAAEVDAPSLFFNPFADLVQNLEGKQRTCVQLIGRLSFWFVKVLQ